MKNVILLNKQFIGGWLNIKGNIAHEIIDFFLDDNNNYYVYNVPHGQCREDIWINGSNEKLRTGKEKYVAKYLILSDKFKNNILNIKYVIELKEKLHNWKNKKNEIEKKNNQIKNRKLIEKLNIKYGNKFLYQMFDEKTDGTQFHVTFRAECIYKANQPLEIKLEQQNFQRNRGYIQEDIHSQDYKNILNKITSALKNNELEIFKLDKVVPKTNVNYNNDKTFLDFALINDNEQIFTNMLWSIFSYKNVFNYFCNDFIFEKNINKQNIQNIQFDVVKEKKVQNGRIDIFASSNTYDVIIENKIHSGLNGIKKEDSCTQLKIYYDHILKERQKEPICFILIPNYKEEDILKEINKSDEKMKNIFKIITYKEIYIFLEKCIKEQIIDSQYVYFRYLNDLLLGIKKHSLTSKELYTNLFCEAISNS